MKFILLSFSIFLFSAANVYQPDEYKIKLGSVIPKDSPWEMGLNEWIKQVDVKSGGQLKIKTYLGGQLGGEVEMIKSIAMGTLQSGAFSLAAISEAVSLPELQVFELPFLFNSDDEADYVMDALYPKMAELMASKGLVLVMWGTNGWRSFGTRNKPITKPADLKGMKMRSQESEVYINFYKALGATPVPIATPEVLVSLKTGMVDGYDQTPIFSVSTGWVSSIKNYTLTNHIYQPGAIVISKRYYDKLPDNLKKAFLQAESRVELQKKSRKYVRDDDAVVLASINKSFGVKVTNLTDAQREEFRKASMSVYKQMEPKIGSSLLKQVQDEVTKFRASKK
jgi:TRAP-type transport system periplasmic protein